jgi:hypothetical protein
VCVIVCVRLSEAILFFWARVGTYLPTN